MALAQRQLDTNIGKYSVSCTRMVHALGEMCHTVSKEACDTFDLVVVTRLSFWL